ncbi:MAG TPA: tripartite tricarboxylate transporter permease [Methanothermobacter sp.]|nr:hypothetical protein [Methanothermobacter sp.]HOK73024.1 tripartite tricarboxylate transporter permease [Methanothermobacter sp.]HOL69330.1 tripartite tricarboxylate transporter permease [Methanothermobacter sp.]HPQ04548.1 tripartite tricarboxylate transporter permease [Methanothermobacter sp.]HPU37025.1 tripartite tricarboxylate transporter permease [Methanothermobacter sp.]
MFDFILACFLGIICGTITGIIPGIHVNTVGAFVFAATPFLLKFFSPEFLAVFLLSMSIAHALLEFIPSMLLGVPDESTALSILPGHRMILEGQGRKAIRLTAIGGLGGIIFTVLSLPLSIIFLPPTYNLIRPYIGLLLLIVSIYLIISLNKNLEATIWSLVIFILSGILGWVMLNTPLSSNISLLCTFSGLFGVSTLIHSLGKHSILPSQYTVKEIRIDTRIIRGILGGGVAGTLLGFLPGFGPAQGSILAQEISGGSDDRIENLLTSLSALNTSDALFSLMTIYLMGNARSGIAVYILKIIENFSLNYLIFFSFASLLSVAASFILCIKLGDFLVDRLQYLDYNKLSKLVIFFISCLVVIFSLWENAPVHFILLAYVTSIAVGLIPHYIGVSKSYLMGVLIIPALAIYL